MRRVAKADESGEAEAIVERLAHRGDGVARIAGRTVHVPLTAPGDHVRIAYGGAHGRVIARLSDGAARAMPPCPHFGACGGCALQHIAPEAYRRFKLDSLRETLGQRGFADPPLADLVQIPEGTRRRATMAYRIGADGAELGFYRAGTRAVLGIESCLLLRPEIMAALPRLKAMLARHLPAGSGGRLHVTLTDAGLDADFVPATALAPPQTAALAQDAPALDLARLALDGAALAVRRKPVIRIDGIAVAPPPRAFLQPSVEGEAQLIGWVKEGVGSAKRVLDLFSGLGTFALPLAREARVHAIDSDGALLAALSEAARHAKGLKPLAVEARDLMRNPVPKPMLQAYDAAVLDPPRAGARLQTEALAGSGIPRIVAVSCNAATFARDARLLCDAGYSLAWIRPLDQFLWSAHIELAALFLREAKR